MPYTNEIAVYKNVPARMRDGTTLMADVYRPANGGTCPVLLTRVPYNKDAALSPSYLDPVRAAQHGYIVVVQDVRGRFGSEGEFSPFVNEYEDGYDTVEWAANLSGADGSVGMFGLSYFGKTQWQAAVMQPPSLKSMAPGLTWGNHLNGVQMRGGALELGSMVSWAQTAIAPEALFRKYRGRPAEFARRLPDLVRIIDAIASGGGYDTLPLSDLPDPDGIVPFLHEGFDRGLTDEIWDYVNIDGSYEEVGSPTFHIGGWYDVFIGETIRQYEAMKRVNACRGAGSAQPPRLLIGPWAHGSRMESTVGELDFGLASSGLFLNYRGDMTDYHLRWFDATLKDDERALADRPPVEVFVMGENRWRGYEEWPVPGSREEKWYLRNGEGLSRQRPAEVGQSYDAYTYDPKNPVLTTGGPLLAAPIHRPGPRDQRPNKDRQDVLLYTSEPLERPYTVIGAVYATLHASSSAPDTDFVARLVDVYPDGRAIGVTDGIIRASARESYPAPGVIEPVEPSPIEPDQVYEYTIDLWATGITFLSGHRLRVEITSSSFPRWARNLNTGESAAHSFRTEVARQKIFHDPERPSHVSLTVVDE